MLKCRAALEVKEQQRLKEWWRERKEERDDRVWEPSWSPAALWSRSKPMWGRKGSQTCLIKPKYMRWPRREAGLKREEDGEEGDEEVRPPQTEEWNERNKVNEYWMCEEKIKALMFNTTFYDAYIRTQRQTDKSTETKWMVSFFWKRK